ncbi:MAG TPA: DUF4157 domain-containing protein, partial [Polyangia bacterium]|nr:DUF4157 domain-containing protein [Polyangia bacterium]
MAGFAPPTRKPGGKPGDRDPFRARGPGRQGNGPWAEHAAPPWAPFLRTFDLGPGVWPVSRSASARANRAETKLPGPSELGLSVSTPSDPAEREADAVAARILEPARAPAAAVSGAPAAPGQIQRQCDACQDEAQNAEQAPEEKVQRHATGAPPVAPGVAAAAGAVSGGGEPLPSDERRFFEARLGHDLSRVRVHADRPAAEAARGIAADAFTLRHAVAFAEGQYRPGTDGGRRLLAHELVHVIQQGQAAPLPGASAPPVRGGGGPRIARLAAGTMETAPASDTARSPSADTPAAAAAAGGLIVDDDARALTAGQVRKSELLAELREASCAAADRELARAGRDTRGCPFVAKWLDHYQDRPAQHLERAIRKYAPGAAAARSAHDYVPLVAARIGQGVATWTSTGQIPRDIPAEMLGEMAGGGLGAAIGGAFSAVTGAIGGALSAIGHLFFKGAPGGARTGADVAGLSARLGPGRALDGATKTRMEGALGGDFGGVRVHDDSVGAGLSRDLNAHAFTLGQHVAFADGTYQPGTPIGDALLAHELAHVVQQSGAAGAAPPDGRGSGDDPTVEQDADRAAAGAVASLHAGVPVGAGERPRVRGGLRLSRCGGSPPPATQTPKQSTSGATGATPGTSGPTPGTAVHPAGETFGDTKQYVREGIDIPQDNARRLLGSSFWQEKLGPDLNVILFPPVSTRFAASAEERDAVLSAVSSRFQAKKPVSSGLPEEPVTIPARGPGTKALTYSLTFLPRDPSTPTDARPRVEVRFRAEGTGATAVPAGAPTGTPATHSDLQFRWNDFPNNNDAEGYFNTFPQEDSQLFSYIQAHPLSASPQIVTTSSTNKLGKVVHESTFAVSGQKPVKVSSDLLIDLAGQSKLQTVTAPQDYASHDAADVELEKPAQDDHQKIGQVRLPPGISADEAL